MFERSIKIWFTAAACGAFAVVSFAADVDITKNRDANIKVWNTLFGVRIGDPIYDADVPAGHRVQVNGAWWATDTSTKQRFLRAGGGVGQAEHAFAPVMPDGPGYTMAVMNDWLSANYGDNRIAFTDAMSETTDISIAIDMEAWRLSGSPAAIPMGTPIDVLNGVSPLLPGYQIGTSPVEFSAGGGWLNPSPFTGTIYSFGEIGFAVPEPASLVLLLMGGASLLRRR